MIKSVKVVTTPTANAVGQMIMSAKIKGTDQYNIKQAAMMSEMAKCSSTDKDIS